MLAFWVALATTATTFFLLLVGGTVNPTGSSLACPDWPTCYGTLFPEMKGGVFFEHGHRLVATLVGAMTVALAAVVFATRRADKPLVKLSLLAVVMVIAQGLLGAVTVIFKLPLLVSTAHLGLSMLFFLLLIYLTTRLAAAGSAPTPRHTTTLDRTLAIAALVGVYLQIVLGALVRHTQSGRACLDDFPLCNGEFWPAWGPAQVHMAHRWFAYLVVLLVAAACIRTFSLAKREGRPLALIAAVAAPVIAVVQVCLGILTVWSFIGVAEVTMHLGGGALLLASMWLMVLGLGPLFASHPAAPQSAGLEPAVTA